MQFIFIEHSGPQTQMKTTIDTDPAYAREMFQYLCDRAWSRKNDFEVVILHV